MNLPISDKAKAITRWALFLPLAIVVTLFAVMLLGKYMCLPLLGLCGNDHLLRTIVATTCSLVIFGFAGFLFGFIASGVAPHYTKNTKWITYPLVTLLGAICAYIFFAANSSYIPEEISKYNWIYIVLFFIFVIVGLLESRDESAALKSTSKKK